MSGEAKHQSSSSPIDTFLIMARNSRGLEAVEVIKKVLDAPGIYTFTELSEILSIQELANSEYDSYWKLLQLFSYGTCKDYAENKETLPKLSPQQIKKLQHLTIVSLAEQGKCIPYSILLQELGIQNLRELEDVIIEAIYIEVIQGKLDQKRAQLEVDTTIGRDIKKEDISTIATTLENWYEACDTILTTLQSQVDRANSEKSLKIQRKEALDQEISNLKKSIKIQSQEVDDTYGNESREALGVERTPKKTIKKTNRATSGKLHK